MEKLSIDQMENLVGGTTLIEYCTQLATIYTSGGWQGGFTLFAQTWMATCSEFDFEVDQ